MQKHTDTLSSENILVINRLNTRVVFSHLKNTASIMRGESAYRGVISVV